MVKKIDKKSPGQAWLEEMKSLDKLIEHIQDQIEMETSALTDTSIRYKDVQVQGSGAKDILGEKMPEIIDLQERLRWYMKVLAERKLKTLKILEKMSARQQDVIMLYYMQNKTLEEVAEEMGMTYRWAWKEKERAMAAFEELLKKCEST